VQNPRLYGWQLCIRHLQDKSLEVDRGWARNNKFEEVAKAKQQFNKLLDNFTNKTRENMKKFEELLTQSRELYLDEAGKKAYDEQADTTRRSLEGVMKELGEVRADAKKVKHT
jgi:predicted transcriptional regulator